MNKTNKIFPAVSSLGRFRGAKTQRPQFALPSGRVEINGEKYLLDRLVCWTFHGPPPAWSEAVAHLDGNLNNNRKDNLAWAKVEVWKKVVGLPLVQDLPIGPGKLDGKVQGVKGTDGKTGVSG